jgi:hypothetical protein
MVSSQDFLGAMEWGHHILSINLGSRKLVYSTAKWKSLQWQRESERCTVQQNLIHSLLLSVTSYFDYNMHVFIKAQSYILDKLHDHWVYTENSYYSDLKPTQEEIPQQWL